MNSRADRKHGDKPSHAIPVWNGILDHRERMRTAIWEYLWCLDRITTEADGLGIVLGGMPVKASLIAAELRSSERSVRANLELLDHGGYIRRKRTPYGFVIHVTNSQKFNVWKRVQETARNRQSDPQEMAEKRNSRGGKVSVQTAEKSTNKEDSAVRSTAVDAAEEVAPSKEAWTAIEVELPIGAPMFQNEWECFHATHLGEPIVIVMEKFIQDRQRRAQSVPPPFYKAKHRLEERGRSSTVSPSLVPEVAPLEAAEVWANR